MRAIFRKIDPASLKSIDGPNPASDPAGARASSVSTVIGILLLEVVAPYMTSGASGLEVPIPTYPFREERESIGGLPAAVVVAKLSAPLTLFGISIVEGF